VAGWGERWLAGSIAAGCGTPATLEANPDGPAFVCGKREQVPVSRAGPEDDAASCCISSQ
jgi:hypothetical protein